MPVILMDLQLGEKIKKTQVFKNFEGFKKNLTLKRVNLIRLTDLYGQATRLGIDYLAQNQNIMKSDFELIKEVVGNDLAVDKTLVGKKLVGKNLVNNSQKK